MLHTLNMSEQLTSYVVRLNVFGHKHLLTLGNQRHHFQLAKPMSTFCNYVHYRLR